jgi:hypothetical protein
MAETEQQQQDILVRLESAVAEWNAQVSRAHQGLSDQLSRAKDHFDAVVQDLREDSVAEKSAASLRQDLQDLETQLQAARQENGTLRVALERARQDAVANDLTRRETEARLAQREQAVVALTAQLAAVEDELARARQGADRAAPAMDSEPASGPDHTLTGQLARALSDRQEAHQEIVTLRSELEMLRRKSAIPATATPQPSGVPDEIAAAALDERGHKRRIGDILVAAGLVAQDQLDGALEEQETSRHRRLGEILVSRGYTAEDLIAKVLASQVQAPYVELDFSTVERGAPALISERLAAHHACIPIRVTDDELTLAMSNPLDLIAIEDVELASGRRVNPVVATASNIAAAIDRYYR